MNKLTPRQTAHEVQRCMDRLADFFPGIADASDSEIDLWRTEFARYDHDVCIAALEQTKRGPQGRYNNCSMHEVFERARSLSAKNNVGNKSANRDWPDIIAMLNPTLAVVGRAERILRCFRSSFCEYESGASRRRDGVSHLPEDHPNKVRIFSQHDGMRKKWLNLTRGALVIEGLPLLEAEEAAAAIFEGPEAFEEMVRTVVYQANTHDRVQLEVMP